MNLIEIKNVEKKYKNGVTALYGANLKVKNGEFCFVIGASGSGKSTLIKMLYREEKPTKGKVIIGGVSVGNLKNRNVYKIRRKLGVVFQDYKLLQNLTAYENVAFALEIYGLSKTEVKKKVLDSLDLVGLKGRVRSLPNELSGGEQQRIAIARAIVNSPKLLICDEPTGNLDPATSMEIMTVIEEINKLGTTIIMATHDQTIVNKMKKRVVTLKEGKIVSDTKKGDYNNEAI
ncbi:MAG: cell division ATP-binding protein FtsE [Bacilli bacterium]